MRWELNLEQRQCLIQSLGLESEFFESFLVRTERRLSDSKFSRGLRLIEGDGEGYRSVLDWLLATLAPHWDLFILNYYEHGTPKLGHAVDFDTIDLIDRLMDAAVRDLYKSYQTLCRAGWLGTDDEPEPSVFMKRTTLAAVRAHITPLFPAAPEHPGARRDVAAA
jgi:hypothetical protein